MRNFRYAHIVLGAIVLWVCLSILFGTPKIFPVPVPMPEIAPVVLAADFHAAGYEDAWIQFIDEKERLVQVQAVASRIVIVFRLKKREDLARYPEGSSITPVTPLCRGGGTDCDIGSQEKLYVGSVEVQPVRWKTYGATRKLAIKNH